MIQNDGVRDSHKISLPFSKLGQFGQNAARKISNWGELGRLFSPEPIEPCITELF